MIVIGGWIVAHAFFAGENISKSFSSSYNQVNVNI
jgi:hypothetical protein